MVYWRLVSCLLVRSTVHSFRVSSRFPKSASLTTLPMADRAPETSPSFVACPKCNGMGRTVRRPSKKQRLRQKREPEQQQQTLYNPCTHCQSTGLLETPEDAPLNVDLPEIAIVGGGLAGLALAAACRHRGIRHTVYERDANFDQRSQGYGLTMQQASKILRALGIAELKDGITSTKHVVHDPNGTVVGEWGLRKWGRTSTVPPKRQNVHISRQNLRWQLYQAAGESNILWNNRLVGMEKVGEKVQLEFCVEEKERVVRTADLVVGADGIRSQVRKLWIGEDHTPLRYLGCIVILGICPLSKLTEDIRDHALLDGETVFQTADGTMRIYMMPFTDTEYMWQLSFPMNESDARALDKSSLLTEARNRCRAWHDPIPPILEATTQVSGYPVYDRPVLTAEMLGADVTLIGDACHPMSPFKGQGANQALLDALALARAIHSSDAESITSFHEEMLCRTSVKVEASAQAAQFLHTAVAVQPGNVTRGAAARLDGNDCK